MKILKYILIVIVIIIFFIGMFMLSDHKLVKRGDDPIYAKEYKVYEDLGITEYRGLGYKIFRVTNTDSSGTYLVGYVTGSLFMKPEMAVQKANFNKLSTDQVISNKPVTFIRNYKVVTVLEHKDDLQKGFIVIEEKTDNEPRLIKANLSLIKDLEEGIFYDFKFTGNGNPNYASDVTLFEQYKILSIEKNDNQIENEQTTYIETFEE